MAFRRGKSSHRCCSNIYIHDIPETTSRKYGYADDLAVMMRRPTWELMEAGLNQDMGILAAYLHEWRLQLSIGKTVSAAYQLNNSEARRELDIFVNNKRLEFQQALRYLGVHWTLQSINEEVGPGGQSSV